MASTYTANSGIEKPGSGEQSGTWGATTNTNFDIIDRAMSGVGTITLSGTTHTLTTSDGAASDGHYKVLQLAGSPSGQNTITISPNDQDKLYFVYNNSGQSVIFTQGSGGNVTISQSDYAIIYADGAGSGAKVTLMTWGAAQIKDNAITTAKIEDDAVTAAKIADAERFASGTRMIFHQTAAPTGWTKDTSHNDKALRITSGTVGTGGTVAFETAFASQTPSGSVSTSVSGTVANHTLTTSQIPSHSHSMGENSRVQLGYDNGTAYSGKWTSNAHGNITYSTQNTGGGGAHNHGWSGSASSSFSGSAMNLDVQFVDIIICQKD
tara:strand:+ start:354 stop:1322 length:969 start_codon:yes stop_codon:yes gene_type:complete